MVNMRRALEDLLAIIHSESPSLSDTRLIESSADAANKVSGFIVRIRALENRINDSHRFCPDCRDKVHDEPCLRCQKQTLERKREELEVEESKREIQLRVDLEHEKNDEGEVPKKRAYSDCCNGGSHERFDGCLYCDRDKHALDTSYLLEHIREVARDHPELSGELYSFWVNPNSPTEEDVRRAREVLEGRFTINKIESLKKGI